MNYITFLLAWRYLRGAQHNNSITTMSYVCFWSIFIAVFSLNLIMSIMNGFEIETVKKLQSIHPQLIMKTESGSLKVQAIYQALTKNFPEISHASPVCTARGIVQSVHKNDYTTIALISGISPEIEPHLTAIQSKLLSCNDQPSTQLTQLLHDNTIIIGEKLAQELSVSPGETITLVYSEDEAPHAQHSHNLLSRPCTIAALFKTGIEEFDAHMLFCSQEHFYTLWPNYKPTQIHLRTHDQIGEEKLIEKMKQFFQLHICSWKDLYPTLLSAIKLEKYSMIFILMLICLVASSNIIALLFMFILKKQGDIALFLSLGMQRHQIKAIFTLLSLFLIGSATCIGLLLSTLTAFIFQRYPFIQLPDIYETTYLPIALNIDNLIFVLGATICIGLIASWIPVHRITYVTIATLLRGNR